MSEAGHNASPETIRRITTTLEAVSAQASPADGPTLGRLSQDVDPPGFELLAAFIPAGGTKGNAAPARTGSAAPGVSSQQKTARERDEKRKLEQTRQVRIAAAKMALQAAKRALVAARNRGQSLESTHKKANAEVKDAEKRKREAEERLKHANAALEEAARRAQNVADDVEEAAKMVEEARRAVEAESKELESLFGEAL